MDRVVNVFRSNKNIRKTSTEAVFEFLLYFFIFFPYITIFNSSTDLQVYSLVVAFLFICYRILNNKFIINKEIIVLVAVSGISIIISLFSGLNMSSFRSLANYLSITFISFSIYNLIRAYGINEKYCKLFILIYFFVGAVQVFIKPDFLSFLLSSARTTAGRGVYGLANEPSFYGISMSLSMLVINSFKKHRVKYMCLAAIQIIFFAQSAMGIIIMSIVLIMCLLGRTKNSFKILKTIFLAVIIMGIAVGIFVVVFPQKRISALVLNLFSGEIFMDQSVTLRFKAITDSLIKFLSSFGFPNGYGDRIMSGFGAPLVEIGVFAIPLIYIVCKSIANMGYVKKNRIISAVFIFIIMLSAIQLAHPLVAFCVGVGMANKEIAPDGSSMIMRLANGRQLNTLSGRYFKKRYRAL